MITGVNNPGAGKPAPARGPKRDPHEEKYRDHIYVHSKVFIVDTAFAMVGSANHNERSMWHDSEDMLAVRSENTGDFPDELRTALFNTVLSGNMPENNSPKKIIDHFERQMDRAARWKKTGTDEGKEGTSIPLIHEYVPTSAIGTFIFG